MKVAAADGVEIDATLFEPEARPRGAVLVVAAMGVAQGYYAPFAQWLAREGFLAATFDYRGTGRSRPGGGRASLRGYAADILDWARLDTAAMVDLLAARAGGAPLSWVGHSLGGQILPFVPNRERVAKAVTVATGSGYWRENAAPLKPRAWLLWHVLAPVALAAFGYFPGARLGMVGDLPHGVMAQWRRWCLHPEYAVGDGEEVRARYAAVRTPITSLSFTDDEFMSARNTESIHAFYAGAPRRMKRLAPADVGVPRIGHFGFFRPNFEAALWRPHLLPELLSAA